MNHLLRIKEMDCALCGQHGPSDAHHILEGRCPGRKSPDMLAIPLCKTCHTSSIGIHGNRSMWKIHKKSELDCLAETLSKLLYP